MKKKIANKKQTPRPRKKQLGCKHAPKSRILIEGRLPSLCEDPAEYVIPLNRGRTSPPPVTRLTVRKKLIPFGWYGGKFSHLDWLRPLLPDCHHYCEPFAGSGAVLLNREPSPVETYNDLDGEVVNFFQVLREMKDRLIEAIGLTPDVAGMWSSSLSDFAKARR